ncbi:MAG: 3-isopropylmalate dehydrogenase [Methylococcales bacterium]
MKKYKIAILSGDGIGPEIMKEAIKVLKTIEMISGVTFELYEADFGANAYFKLGHSFPDKTKTICINSDAILKGPVGLCYEETKKIPIDQQPERGAILPLRNFLNTYANIRPVYLSKYLSDFSPLKNKVIENGIDFIIVRELLGGLYFGEKKLGINENGKRYVKETLEYNEDQIKQILIVAFEIAMKRKKVLHHIHKSNVLKSSVLWNEIIEEVAEQYPEVEIKYQLVDSTATFLCLNPGMFDVMVMENMFGDILSDQGGGILGSLGLMPSACLGDKVSYYEPSHGSAPDIAGQNIANPYSMIGSVAMMLEYSFGMVKESKSIWDAIQKVLIDGFCTQDLFNLNADANLVSTDVFGDKVVSALLENK